MGAPKRLRKTYETPTMKWNKERIDEEHKLKDAYGLKTLKELWRAKSELRKIRGNARKVLSTNATEEVGRQIVARLARYNIVRQDAKTDDLLLINVESLLDRRLQTIVFKRGMANTMNQSRQLITHGFVAIDGKRVTSPSYLVKAAEEQGLSYYKPIKLEKPGSAKAQQGETAKSNAESEKPMEAKQ